MSKNEQTSKNLALTYRLIDYISTGEDVPDLPPDVSFIPFSRSDKKLNKENEELLKLLSQDEDPVVMAQEPETEEGSWKLVPVNF